MIRVRPESWVAAAVRREAREIGRRLAWVWVLADRRPTGCPRRRWQRLQRAKRMGRLA